MKQYSLFTGNQNELLDIFQQHLLVRKSSKRLPNAVADEPHSFNRIKPTQKTGKMLTVFTPNPEQIVQAETDGQFARVLQQADYLLPDGIGLVWASKILPTGKLPKIKQRLTGVFVAKKILSLTQKHQLPLLIVGGQAYDQAFAKSLKKSSNLYQLKDNLFWTSAYQDVRQPQAKEEKKFKRLIAKLQPAVILVAFGAPWQEKWVSQHERFLQQQGVSLVMVVGGAFDFIFGQVKRAPAWLQSLGGEWLFRLYQQPWRWRRQLRLIKFVYLVIGEYWQGLLKDKQSTK